MPFSKLLPKTRILTVCFFALVYLLTSCKKHTETPSPASFQVRIDSISVIAFNQIKVNASYTSAGQSNATRLGVCWGTSPNPIANTDTIVQPRPGYNQLDTLISKLDSNTVYYLRAYCIQNRDTTYSRDTTVKTGALELTFLQQYSTNYDLEIKQVVSLGTGGYVVLSMAIPLLSPEAGANLTRFDTSGNRLWSMDYDVGQNKQPSVLLPVSDGYLFATDSMGYGTDMPVLCKTDLNGNLLWEEDFPAGSWSSQRPAQLFPIPNSSDIGLSVATQSIVGDTAIAVGPLYQFVIDPNGNLQTTAQFSGINLWQSFVTTPVTSNGYLALILNITSPGDPPGAGMMIESVSGNNSPLWSQIYSRGRTTLDPVACVQDGKGNFTVLTWLDGQNVDSGWLFNLDAASGNTLWQTTYPASPFYGLQGHIMPTALALASTGNYYATGGDFILKTDPSGNYIWDFNTATLTLGIPEAIYVSSGNAITIIGMIPSGNNGQIDELFFARMQEY